MVLICGSHELVEVDVAVSVKVYVLEDFVPLVMDEAERDSSLFL